MNEICYQGELYIYPQEKSLKYSGHIDYTFNNNKDYLDVYIYRLLDLQINNDLITKVEILNEFKRNKFIPEAKVYRLYLNQEFKKGEVISFDVKVEGIIEILKENTVNRITEEFVEIGVYASWFPVFDDLRLSNFEIKTYIDKDYEIISTSVIKEKDYYLVKTINPANDLSIIALKKPNIIEYHYENIHIKVYSTTPETLKISNEIANYSQEIITYYVDKIGKLDEADLKIVLINRKIGGGYCRENLIVLSITEEIEDKILYRYIAHEVGHLWWNKANVNSYEDWLNESFAEYSALLSYKQKFGKQAFLKKISRYQELAKPLGPILYLKRDDEDAYMLLYVKGPIILYQFHNKIGNRKFFKFLKDIHKHRITTTNDVFTYIESVFGLENKEFLENLLNT